ncbi:MAG: helix-hairpin-helix domain-containing protein, partial [Rhodothermaceae bacterium]|nr:helix-hairpin-helix domain-containing protein [Rhodothermaceae bacterium]
MDEINIDVVRDATGVTEVPDVIGISEVTEVPGVWGITEVSKSLLIPITILLTFLLLMYAGCTRPASAQDLPDVVLNMTDSLEDEDDAAGLIDYFEELLTNPVNVNTASIDQLMMIPGIRPQQAEALVAYRTGNGSFDS